MGMLLTGRLISAAEAFRMGLVNEVVPGSWWRQWTAGWVRYWVLAAGRPGGRQAAITTRAASRRPAVAWRLSPQ